MAQYGAPLPAPHTTTHDNSRLQPVTTGITMGYDLHTQLIEITSAQGPLSVRELCEAVDGDYSRQQVATAVRHLNDANLLTATPHHTD